MAHEPAVGSADGRFVVFESDATDLIPGDEANTEVYVRDRRTGKTRKLSIGIGEDVANGLSGNTAISPNSRLAAFVSTGVRPSWPATTAMIGTCSCAARCREASREALTASLGALHGRRPGHPASRANGSRSAG